MYVIHVFQTAPAFSIMQPSLLREGILHHLDYPVVFNSMVETWNCSHWSLEDWACFFGDKLLYLRVGKQDEEVCLLLSYSFLEMQFIFV